MLYYILGESRENNNYANSTSPKFDKFLQTQLFKFMLISTNSLSKL